MEWNNSFFDWAKANHWTVERAKEKQTIPDEVKRRYPEIPTAYADFFSLFQLCSNAADTKWFLTREDFLQTDEEAFAWNTFEEMSLEAAEGDEGLVQEIKSYWNVHLPVLLSVEDEYEYYALHTGDGTMVKGYGPEFEDSAEKIADSFRDFLEKVTSGRLCL